METTMNACEKCGSKREQRDIQHCGNVEFCPQCETTKYVRSKIYLNGKEVEYCVEVNTKTGESRILYSEEEKRNDRKAEDLPDKNAE
jgi:predicted nucleic-acid-binding Zn-ribbon protein